MKPETLLDKSISVKYNRYGPFNLMLTTYIHVSIRVYVLYPLYNLTAVHILATITLPLQAILFTCFREGAVASRVQFERVRG